MIGFWYIILYLGLVLCFFVCLVISHWIWAFEKTVTSLGLCILALYRGISLPISLVRDSRAFETFSDRLLFLACARGSVARMFSAASELWSGLDSESAKTDTKAEA